MERFDEFIRSECEALSGDLLDRMLSLFGVATLGELLHRPESFGRYTLEVFNSLAERATALFADRDQQNEGNEADADGGDKGQLVGNVRTVAFAQEAEHRSTKKGRNRSSD